jgi:guanylate kinase
MGPSGSGKTAIGKGSGLPELVSHTSRDMRKGEVHGETYYFVTKKDIDKMNKAEFTEYAGNYYCLSTREVERKLEDNDSVFVIMDRNGVRQMKGMYGDEVRVIYIDVPFYQLAKRLYKRDGFKAAFKRVWHMIKTRERKNKEIADYVIKNSDGKLNLSIAVFGEIVRLHSLKEIEWEQTPSDEGAYVKSFGDRLNI